MTREKFTSLVARLERKYSRRPAALKRVALAWTALGFTGFLFIIAARLAAGAVVVIAGITARDHSTSFFAILAGAALMVWGLLAALRYLWVESPPPEGVVLTAAQAPELFAAIKRLRRRTGAKPLHSVMLTPEYNAGMYQQPRLGWLGFMRNHLSLGLPLMESQSPEEILSVIAHELAHLSAQHGRTGAWIYRLRKCWAVLFEQLQQRQGARRRKRMLEWFLNWYWPRFNARAFVLSRANEYHADATAAEATGTEIVAQSLLRLKISVQRLNRDFWPSFWKNARTAADPPADSIGQLREFLCSPCGDGDERLRRAAFRMLTTNDDTHPSLSDRWRSLGVVPPGESDSLPPVPPPPEYAASVVLLGTALEESRREVERFAQRAFVARWAAEKSWAEMQANSLAAGEAGGHGADDAVERQWEQAQSCFALHQEERAVGLLDDILTRCPDHARSRLSLASHWLEKDDARGEEHAREVMRLDDSLAWPAAGMLREWYARSGNAAALAELERVMDIMEKRQRTAGEALSKVSAADTFKAHGIPPEEVAGIRAALRQVRGLKKAWLSRKAIRGSHRRLYVLRVSRTGFLPSFHDDLSVVRRAASALSLPGRLFVFTAGTGGLRLAGKVSRAGERLF